MLRTSRQLIVTQVTCMFLCPKPNKSFEWTARQLASYQPCVVSLRRSLAGGQPLNSSVGRKVEGRINMKTIKYIYLYSLAIAFAVILLAQSSVFSQTLNGEPQTVTLLARKEIDGIDNYTQAAFSFKYGVNGDAALKVTRNNWDLLFGNSPLPDAFDVTMVTDDCSRIKDLGALNWSDAFDVPALPAYLEPTREPSVKAIVGHLYVVHIKDRENDHYALFRVESLEPGKSVTISWKLIASPE